MSTDAENAMVTVRIPLEKAADTIAAKGVGVGSKLANTLAAMRVDASPVAVDDYESWMRAGEPYLVSESSGWCLPSPPVGWKQGDPLPPAEFFSKLEVMFAADVAAGIRHLWLTLLELAAPAGTQIHYAPHITEELSAFGEVVGVNPAPRLWGR